MLRAGKSRLAMGGLQLSAQAGRCSNKSYTVSRASGSQPWKFDRGLALRSFTSISAVDWTFIVGISPRSRNYGSCTSPMAMSSRLGVTVSICISGRQRVKTAGAPLSCVDAVQRAAVLPNKRMQLSTLVFRGRPLSCETGEFCH